jgi:hypothetical protein
MITLFSAPKSFVDEHISRIQRNALRSWLALGEDVEVLYLGDEIGIEETAEVFNVRCLPTHSRSSSGAPFINELFGLARQHAHYSILCYVNADIILLDDFMPSVHLVRKRFNSFLVVGNRYDLEIKNELKMQEDWQEYLRERINRSGRLHPPMGSDYFIFRKDQFEDMPAFVLGRAGWDNWMMYKVRSEGLPLVDASRAITAVHQEHDYAHLPGGEPHYRHPESMLNIQLAGGYEAMFRLRDSNWVLSSRGLRKKSLGEWEWPRKIEADLISTFGTGSLARLVRMIFHPKDAILYFRQKLSDPDQINSVESGDREGAL